MATNDASVDLDLIAATLRAETSDLDAFVSALAVKLELIVPSGVRVERVRRGLMGPKAVRRITVDAGEEQLELLVEDGRLDTRCSRLSGGIVLKREQLDVEPWLDALGRVLAAEAGRNQRTRQALERLLLH
jgi:hypothetical protein